MLVPPLSMPACPAISLLALLLCADLASAQEKSFGQRLYQDKADCQFCHGVNGDGRGDPRSPGKAPDLHQTRLDREQLIEVIACGRPGSEMPHFDKYAYEAKDCYGLSAEELGKNVPPDPHSTSLNKREIIGAGGFHPRDLRGEVRIWTSRVPLSLSPPSSGRSARRAEPGIHTSVPVIMDSRLPRFARAPE